MFKLGPAGRSEPRVVDPNVYLIDCFRLARKIWDDGYRPEFLVALWRGGAQPGIVIQEFFRWKGHDSHHTAIQTQFLDRVGYGARLDIKGFEHVMDSANADDQLLLIDDVFDSGRTIWEVISYLRHETRRNAPEVRVATVYFQSGRPKFAVCPDYYLHEVEDLPLLPDRLSKLSENETRLLDPELYKLLYG